MEPTSILKRNNAQINYFIYIVASIGALGGILFGFDTGVISGALLFINKNFQPSTLIQEIIVSCVVLGALMGAIASGWLADAFGRRRMLINAAIAFIIGTLITVFASSIAILIVGRFILGLAIGVTSYTVPLFISEMAPAAIRGSLVLLNAITITGGEALAYLVDYLLAPTHSWRWMFAMGLLPALLFLLGMLAMPATPRWIMLKGFHERAREILRKIRPHQEVDFEWNELKKSFFSKPSHWSHLFSKKCRGVLMVGIGLGLLQQLVGINTVMYYGPIIFQQAGFQGAKAEILATLGIGLVNTFMSVVAFMIVDKMGRRRLLLIGSLCSALSLAIVGLCFNGSETAVLNRWMAVLALVAYIAGYCISVGSLFWLIISEIYPLNIRGFAMSFVSGIQWGANFLVAVTFLSILHTMGARDTFWLYGIMSLICFVFSYCFVPETQGVSLETIERNIQLGKPTRELGQPVGEATLLNDVGMSP